MRIAVSGTHITGKSSLVEALGACLPHHRTVPEPYVILEERGYPFAHPPTVEDYVMQLKQSLISLRRSSPNVLFDRCPLDFLGYIFASSDPEAEQFDLAPWRAEIAHAMQSLDLVVALHADAAHDPHLPNEDAAFRLTVNDILRDIVEDDSLDLCQDIDILPLTGPWDRRLEAVLAHIATRTNRPPATANEAHSAQS